MLSKDRKLQRDRLEQLQEYINDLEEYKEIEFEKLQQDKLVLRYLTRTLYLALDTILDLGCQIIVNGNSHSQPDSRQIIEIMAEENIIKKNGSNYVKLAEIRDSIANASEDIAPEILLEAIKENLDDLKTIFKWYRDYIE
ncbi:MAG: DUF86 domain-containing protein [Halanaerobium sp.]